MQPKPLPQDLSTSPFLVGESGLPDKRLRAPDLLRTVWGVRALGDERSVDVRVRCRLFATRLPDAVFFSHSTSALLLGAPLPLALERERTIHVAVAEPARAPHATGLIGHRLDVRSDDVVRTSGLRQTSAARTWFDIASMLELDDLVAVGDFLLHWELPLVSRRELEQIVDRMPGARGIRRARAALPLLSDRPASRQESRLRLIVLRSGLPEPEINHKVVDTETGRHVRPDFIFREYKLILEYQGDYHRSKSQWRKDMTRRSRLEAQGWYVMELNADDLDDPAELISRIQLVINRRAPR